MIGKGKRRKDIQDNNNYIRRLGVITFVCPKCGNLYQVTGELNVDLHLEVAPCEVEGYSVTTPSINKVCNCGADCIQVDNAIATTVKMLIDKGYNVLNACEGHAYNENAVLSYDFPYLCIDGTIKSAIPTEYFSKLLIYEDFDKTIITCGNTSILEDGACPCDSLEQYNTYKSVMIGHMFSLAKAISKANGETDDNSSTCDCGCCAPKYGQ